MAAVIGSEYAALIFELYPPCAVLTDKVGSLYRDPIERARGTLDYSYVVVYGDTATAYRAAALVRRVHRAIKATCPTTGATLSPAEPTNALWLHMTAAEGWVRAYQAYGPEALTAGEVDRFWAEFVPFAELQGVPRDMVPASAAEAEAYFAEMYPKLALTPAGRRGLDQVLRPRVDGRTDLRLLVGTRVLAESAVALLDHEVRALVGVHTPRASGPAVRAAFRQVFGIMRRIPGALPDGMLARDSGANEIDRAARAKREWVSAGCPPVVIAEVDLEASGTDAPPVTRETLTPAG
jgi:uncharacterized protein (DUF2236 family)